MKPKEHTPASATPAANSRGHRLHFDTAHMYTAPEGVSAAEFSGLQPEFGSGVGTAHARQDPRRTRRRVRLFNPPELMTTQLAWIEQAVTTRDLPLPRRGRSRHRGGRSPGAKAAVLRCAMSPTTQRPTPHFLENIDPYHLEFCRAPETRDHRGHRHQQIRWHHRNRGAVPGIARVVDKKLGKTDARKHQWDCDRSETGLAAPAGDTRGTCRRWSLPPKGRRALFGAHHGSLPLAAVGVGYSRAADGAAANAARVAPMPILKTNPALELAALLLSARRAQAQAHLDHDALRRPAVAARKNWYCQLWAESLG